jgi:hypothetical protein
MISGKRPLFLFKRKNDIINTTKKLPLVLFWFIMRIGFELSQESYKIMNIKSKVVELCKKYQ